MFRILTLLVSLAVLGAASCSLAPDTAWDSGDPFAKVRLLFES